MKKKKGNVRFQGHVDFLLLDHKFVKRVHEYESMSMMERISYKYDGI